MTFEVTEGNVWGMSRDQCQTGQLLSQTSLRRPKSQQRVVVYVPVTSPESVLLPRSADSFLRLTRCSATERQLMLAPVGRT